MRGAERGNLLPPCPRNMVLLSSLSVDGLTTKTGNPSSNIANCSGLLLNVQRGPRSEVCGRCTKADMGQQCMSRDNKSHQPI
jgi:hypothetical protein